MKIIFGKILILAIIFSSMMSCTRGYTNKEEVVSGTIRLNNRLSGIFSKTKILCFGRYALTVPIDTKLIIGSQSVDTFKTPPERVSARINEDIEQIYFKSETANIMYNKEGPIENSWQLRYYESDVAKELNLLYFKTYITKGNITFIARDAMTNKQREEDVAKRQHVLAKNIRLRDEDDTPEYPGLCLEHGFLAEQLYKTQEIDSAGIYIPGLPDVRFSISSNKDAYGDYPPEQFEKEEREELSLLNRIQSAKDIQGSDYPKRTLLREGKRTVQHWKGEESLIRRTDGVHDFEWALVGKPKDVANPSVLEVKMYTKVAHNMVGAAEASSLTDEEAIALWDKLLSGLKFRVKVPGAPPGSYYIDPDKPAQ
ncbi:T6SS immunity protein Tli4 family protein [Janthinobacterium sp. GMG1]|uniref:T6SS immunity protein Tli4 family protein n=1 Tax=Janthinobacterium sp. GMG1 TaxID=3096007 RepID=UPI002ACA29FA|nr:T6SS immunity protein Tli4 family protein [Janthinobacterium sp. GMG1]MDZ5634759.1 T6SS immunity protein Tli4 family protein [Janthinobacterium sp. GMG1]